MPATAIVTTVFERLGAQTASALGMSPDLLTVIAHPVWTRDDDWFQELAVRLEPEIVAKLTDHRPEI